MRLRQLDSDQYRSPAHGATIRARLNATSTHMNINANAVETYLTSLQESIISTLEGIDGQAFRRDSWQRAEGGGGVSGLIEEGNVFERAGVLFSHVTGSKLPATAAANRPEIAGRSWEAMGVSLVLHPRNPMAPTVHMNVRFFVAHEDSSDNGATWWFGGGMDLTPYYLEAEHALHFHRMCKSALAPYGEHLHPRFKKWCDEYFYLKHRKEPRGVGGIFYDDFSELGFEQSFAMTRSVGNHFLEAYIPILNARKDLQFGERERDFQAYRRGRYVEFNLVWDRGTLFGLQSGGRTESILMSMPPVVKWRYDWSPEPGTAEALLYTALLPHREWV
jgi:coproporphyrinogen III oxidase